METADKLILAVQGVVLHPNLVSALYLIVTSTLNEVVAILPYTFIISSQLLFLKGMFSFGLLSKLFCLVSVPVGIGTGLGSLPVYGLAYAGGKPAIEKFQKYLRFSWKDIEKINSRFSGTWYDEWIFLLLRAIPVVPGMPVNVAAGLIRMRFWPYLILTMIGATIRMMLMFLFVILGIHAFTFGFLAL